MGSSGTIGPIEIKTVSNNLRTSSWDIVYTYLKVTDAIDTQNIYSAKNDTLVSQVGYPIVIIGVPSVSYLKLNTNGTITDSNIKILFQIFHETAKGVKVLSDNVTYKLRRGRTTFAGERLMKMEIDEGDYDSWEEGSRKVHVVSFTVDFRFIGAS